MLGLILAFWHHYKVFTLPASQIHSKDTNTHTNSQAELDLFLKEKTCIKIEMRCTLKNVLSSAYTKTKDPFLVPNSPSRRISMP